MPVIDRIVTGSLRTNCYVVADPTGDAVLIDPGDDAERIMEHLAKREYDLLGVLLTHAHDDHLGAAAEIAESLGVRVHMHPADTPLLRRASFYRVILRSEAPIRIPEIDVELADGMRLCFGALEFDVLHTPGHTPGSTCLEIGGAIFTGDTIFAGHVGRTDLPGSERARLIESLRLLARRSRDGATIYPGHGETAPLDDVLPLAAELPELR